MLEARAMAYLALCVIASSCILMFVDSQSTVGQYGTAKYRHKCVQEGRCQYTLILPECQQGQGECRDISDDEDTLAGTVTQMGVEIRQLSEAVENLKQNESVLLESLQQLVSRLSDAIDPCKNGATRVNYQVDYTCNCSPGYTGRDCELEIDVCVSNPCQNSGNCTNFSTFYTCTCLYGWTGTNCEEPVNTCVSSPCRNGAVCVNSQISYMCACAPGWLGDTCEQAVDPCDSNPCLNGGTCYKSYMYDVFYTYTCQCPINWEGVNCQIAAK